MENENSEPSFLWYSIAMLYKYSTLPVIASVAYIVLIAKDWPFVYENHSVSVFCILCFVLIGILTLMITIESQPSYFTRIYPDNLIRDSESFIIHYRLFITSLRWFWLITVFYLLCINSFLPSCKDSLSLQICHWQLFFSKTTLGYLLAIGVLIFVYVYIV
ncbi:hypothetical protein WA171_003922, partial [Blastocystis sp. BT1]